MGASKKPQMKYLDPKWADQMFYAACRINEGAGAAWLSVQVLAASDFATAPRSQNDSHEIPWTNKSFLPTLSDYKKCNFKTISRWKLLSMHACHFFGSTIRTEDWRASIILKENRGNSA